MNHEESAQFWQHHLLKGRDAVLHAVVPMNLKALLALDFAATEDERLAQWDHNQCAKCRAHINPEAERVIALRLLMDSRGVNGTLRCAYASVCRGCHGHVDWDTLWTVDGDELEIVEEAIAEQCQRVTDPPSPLRMVQWLLSAVEHNKFTVLREMLSHYGSCANERCEERYHPKLHITCSECSLARFCSQRCASSAATNHPCMRPSECLFALDKILVILP